MIDDPDFDLVRRCQSGDSDIHEPAFRELFERYRDRVFNTAFRVVGNASDAADVSQEVFLALFRKIGEFQFGSRFFTWLYRITVNLSIDRRRRTGVAPPPVTDAAADGEVALLADERGAGDRALADQEFLETRVHQSIQRLSPKLQAIIVLRYVEGLAYEDIAEVMSCSIGTVKSRLNRAHSSLEVLLKPLVDELAGKDGA